jgi:hypothetical protein
MDMSMAFERLMTQILGQKAYQSAGQFANPTTRDDWFRKTFKLMLKEVDKIDTTSRQKQMLMRDLHAAIDGLSGSRDPSWEVMFSLVSACARFLGHNYSGARVNTPCYWQSPDQRFTQAIFENAERKFEHTKEDAVTIRAKICRELRANGTDTFTIALVLNTSEYQVKKLIRENA